MGGAWETYRWDWAAQAALDHYANGRLLEMNHVLNGVPSDWQPFAKTAFVDRLPDRRAAETDPAMQFLNDARTALRKSNLPDTDKYGCYFVLLRLVVKHDPAASSAALKEAIASLNRAEQAATTKDQKTLDTSNLSLTLSASLLEMDEAPGRAGRHHHPRQRLQGVATVHSLGPGLVAPSPLHATGPPRAPGHPSKENSMSIPATPAPGTPQTATKAWVGAVVAALASLVATVQGRTDLDTMRVVDWLIVVVSAVVAGLTVYTIPNQPKR
jgi:hypothetical protein